MNQNAALNLICQDILKFILSYGEQKDIKAFMLVCREWYDICIHHYHFSAVVNDEKVLEGTRRKIDALRMNGCKINKIETICSLENLNRLVLEDCSFNEEYFSILSNKKIKSLELWSERIGEEHLVHLKNFQHLEKLALNSSSIGIECLKYVKQVENIKELDISYINQERSVDNETFSILQEGICKLACAHNYISEIGFLRRLKDITHLNLNDNMIVDFGPLKEMDNLVDLSISGNKCCPIGAREISLIPNLKKLDISLNKIGDLGLSYLCANLKSLTSLNVQDNEITKTGAQCLLALVSLKDLDMTGNLLGCGLSGMPALPLLESLKWAESYNIDDIKYIPLFKSLKKLNFHGLSVPVSDIQYIMQLENLTHLSISLEYSQEYSEIFGSMNRLVDLIIV